MKGPYKYLIVCMFTLILFCLMGCKSTREAVKKTDSLQDEYQDVRDKGEETLEELQSQIVYIIPNTCSALVFENYMAGYGLDLVGSKISSDVFYNVIKFCKEHSIEVAKGHFTYDYGKLRFSWKNDEYEFEYEDKKGITYEISYADADRFMDGIKPYIISDELYKWVKGTSYSYGISQDKKVFNLSSDRREWPMQFTWELADKIMEMDPAIDEVGFHLPKKNMSISFFRKGTDGETGKTLEEYVREVYAGVVAHMEGSTNITLSNDALSAIYENWDELQESSIDGRPVKCHKYETTIEFVYDQGIVLRWYFEENRMMFVEMLEMDSSVDDKYKFPEGCFENDEGSVYIINSQDEYIIDIDLYGLLHMEECIGVNEYGSIAFCGFDEHGNQIDGSLYKSIDDREITLLITGSNSKYVTAGDEWTSLKNTDME